MDYGSRWWQDYNLKVMEDNRREREVEFAKGRPAPPKWKRTRIDVPQVSSKWLWFLGFIGAVMGIGVAPELGATALTGGAAGGILGMMVIPAAFTLWWITVIVFKISMGALVIYIAYLVFANSG